MQRILRFYSVQTKRGDYCEIGEVICMSANRLKNVSVEPETGERDKPSFYTTKGTIYLFRARIKFKGKFY
jgi:hypothetical protein